MTNYEYCRTGNKTIKGSWKAPDQYQQIADKLTPDGVERIKEGKLHEIMNEKKTMKMLNEFDNSLIADGWMEVPEARRFFARPETESDPGKTNEYCILELNCIGSEKSGMFGKTKYTWQYTALRLTPRGAVKLAESNTSTDIGSLSRSGICSKLMADDWELVAGQDGSVLSRTVGVEQGVVPTASPPAEDHIEKLKKLAELRDAGVLSDDEFQQKKTQILDRI